MVLITHLLAVWGFHRSFDRLRDPLILLAAATVGRMLDMALDLTNGFVLAWLAPDYLAPFYRRIMIDATGTFPSLTPAVVSNAAHWAVNCIAGIMLLVPIASARLDEIQKWYYPSAIVPVGIDPRVVCLERCRTDAAHGRSAAVADHGTDVGGMGCRAIWAAGRRLCHL